MINKRKISFAFSWVWAVIIFVFSAIPGSSIKLPPVWNLDKILHFIVYAILSFLISLSYFYKIDTSKKQILIYPFLISIIYGGILEILQENFFVGRFGDYLDFTANSMGAFIVLVIFWIVIRFSKDRIN